MISYKKALKLVLANAKCLTPENLAIQDSAGITLAENIYSGIEMPPFNKSAMDGYAVISRDTKNAPIKLRCIGLIQAGKSFRKSIKKGECVKIMTGAPLPQNADSVVMVENTQQNNNSVLIKKSVQSGENICFKGEDIKTGQNILQKGTVISPSHIAVIASVGRKSIKAIRKPLLSILNTGGEIVQPGKKLKANKIFNSNGPMLETLLRKDGITPACLGIAKDNIKELKNAVKKGLNSDILLISGGVSMGDYDFIPHVLNKSEVKQIFHKVSIKPGKPLFFGKKGKTIIFGIPGNPVSNFLIYMAFIRPAILKMEGYKPPFLNTEKGYLRKQFSNKSGRTYFGLVNIFKLNGKYFLEPVKSHGSADIVSLAKADGFMILDKKIHTVREGSLVSFISWKIK